MTLRQAVKTVVYTLLALILLTALTAGGLWVYFHPRVTRTDAVVYGQRHGTNLTLDVIQPTSPNGLAVAVMVSGGWKSSGPGGFPTWMAAPLLRRGYTVFAICHISQPASTVMEIIEDMQRGVRYVVRRYAA